MTERPEPLTPFGCDLSGHEWFPFHHRRLLESRWWRTASDLCRSRNVDLWSRAFAQVPAGSLPDDDMELSHFAGFGRDTKAFQAVKAEMMGAWVLCSDDRWYHPTVCEVALEAWERLSDKRQKDRVKKAQQRSRSRRKDPLSPSKTAPVPRDIDACPPGQGAFSPGTGAVSDPLSPSKTAPVPRKNAPTGQDTYSVPSERAPSAPPDPDREAWSRAVQLLVASGARESHARSFFGGLLRDHKLAGRDLLPSVIRAETNGTLDPQSYLKQAARNVAERRGRSTEQPAATPDDWTEAHWAVAIRLFREDGSWGDSMGPKPGEPGCRVPAHLIPSADVIPLRREA